jgi:acetoin utilization protein AcuA
MQKSENQKQVVFQKPPFDSIDILIEIDTTIEPLRVRGPIKPEDLSVYNMAEGLCCFRNSCSQHNALIELAGDPDGIIFAASFEKLIVSYVSFQKPDYPWWKRRHFSQLLELGSIETDLAWRKKGLGKILMDAVLRNAKFTYFEDYITIAPQFIHSWDLKNTGLAAWAYRQLIVNFLMRYEFTSWETIDPEIREHPCNILLARIGKKIPENKIDYFSCCCLDTN